MVSLLKLFVSKTIIRVGPKKFHYKKHMCWSKTNIWINRRGSTPRTKLTGKRRGVYETKSNKITYSSSQGVNHSMRNGAKFKNLRNRRGIKKDKLVQTRLDLSMVLGGDSNFYLSQCNGESSSGNRKAGERDNESSKKFKS